MTESDVKRASDLIATRDNIIEFLSARDAGSEFVRSLLESKYEHEQRDGCALRDAAMAAIEINDGSTFEEENPDTLGNWFVLRDVLERALKAELPRISMELRELGVEEGAD